MTETISLLAQHGLLIVFAIVLLEQLGLPLPAPPVLLAAGALSAAGQFNVWLGIVVTMFACLIADYVWFYLGRRRGGTVLGWLCRISLEPDSCVRRTQNMFTRHGMRVLVLAKFIPGLSTIAPPLAGMSGVGTGRFLLLDGAGALLYGAVCFFLGRCFSNQLGQILQALSHIGAGALALLISVFALYIGFKFWQRQRLLRELRAARITVDELYQQLAAGGSPLIFDLRARAELESDPAVIQGAIHLDFEALEKRHHEFPRDQDIVMYCSCPNEVTSAKAAQALRRKGFTRVRPLLGGIDSWRQRNYPVESYALKPPEVSGF